MSMNLRARWRASSLARRVAVALGAAALVVPLVAAPAQAADTGTIAVCVTDSTGANVIPNGDQTWWQQGSSAYVGAVGASGCRESIIPVGSTNVWVGLNGTLSDHRTVTVTKDTTTKVTFYTTKVTIRYAGDVAFGGPFGNSSWFKQSTADGSKELLSNGTPVMFRMDSSAGAVRTPVSWPIASGIGQQKAFTLMAMQVKKNDGTGLAGATARYKAGYDYAVTGFTDANGLLGWSHSGLVASVDVQAKAPSNTTQTKTFDATTTKLFSFQTTRLTVHYNDTIMFYYSGYASNWNGSPMEVFAGTYPVKFRTWVGAEGANAGMYAQTSITVPEPANGPVEKTALVVRAHDSTGAGIVGTITYYNGGWAYPGTQTNMGTDWGTAGNAPLGKAGAGVVLLDGAPTNVVVALVYNGTRQQLPAQNVQTKPLFYFKTAKVDVKLADSANAPLAGGGASYYASGWYTIGTTDASGKVSVEMLPGSYSFAMTYLGTREQFNGQSVALPSSTITFQTGKVHDVTDGSVSSYYANGWKPFTQDMELLNGKYWFGFNDGTPQAQYVLTGHGVTTYIPPLLNS